MTELRLWFAAVFAVTFLIVGMSACDDVQTSTEQKQSEAQAASLEQAHAQVGMPAISRFQEKKMMKDIYELRDKEIATHAYLVNEMRGCLVYLGAAIGYGLPYGTQYTSPTRWTYLSMGAGSGHYESVPQPEPNGLYVPETAEGTWLMLRDPNDPKGDVRPVYIEPRVIVSPFKLPQQECAAVDAVVAKK